MQILGYQMTLFISIQFHSCRTQYHCKSQSICAPINATILHQHHTHLSIFRRCLTHNSQHKVLTSMSDVWHALNCTWHPTRTYKNILYGRSITGSKLYRQSPGKRLWLNIKCSFHVAPFNHNVYPLPRVYEFSKGTSESSVTHINLTA